MLESRIRTSSRPKPWCASVLSLFVLGAGCSDGHSSRGADAGADGGADDGGQDKPDKPAEVGPFTITTTPKKQKFDLFAKVGHRLWFDVDEENLTRINNRSQAGSDSLYVPDVPGAHADHLAVQDVDTGEVADYGKVEIKLIGESSFQPWTDDTIPNVRVDMDEFEDDLLLGGYEHFRLNNGQVGSIFREALAHRVFQALGYPALRATHAFFGGSAWGKKTWVPATLIEVYKLPFCEANKDLLEGGCTNIWEFAGDAGGGGGGGGPIFDRLLPPVDEPLPPFGGMGNLDWLPINACQLKSCDNTRMQDLADALASAPDGVGFGDALAPIVDWQRHHEFQCIGWILWTGDDALRNSNNNVIIERLDGKLIWAPYSVDISAGQSWYRDTSLLGTSAIARGCQRDRECWAEAIEVCETLIERFDALNPEQLVDEVVRKITKADMMREGDEQRAKDLRAWYVARQKGLADELERYRYLPGPEGCPEGLELCGDNETCGTAVQCEERQCGGGQTFCDSLGRCIGSGEGCPDCNQKAPYFCPISYQCVDSWSVCDQACVNQNGADYMYCRAWEGCAFAWECPQSESDGGVEPLDSGITSDAGVSEGGVPSPKF